MRKLTIALILLAALLPSYTAFAESDFTIEDGVLTAYSGSGGSVVIPDEVTVIGEYAFSWQTKVTSVTIPDSVTAIGDRAFLHCTGLTSVRLPKSVAEFGLDVFGECSSLKSISVDEANTVFRAYDGILYDRNHTGVVECPAGKSGELSLPDGVTQVGSYAFYKCTALTGVTLPEGVANIGDSAFFGCTSLAKISLPYGLKVISDYAFEDCRNLQQVELPDSVVSIGKCAFYKCATLNEVQLSNGLVSIAERTFNNCPKLTHVTIPSGVKWIDSLAFCDCTTLAWIEIPDSVISIAGNAFTGCGGLTVYCNQGSYAESYAREAGIPCAPLRLPTDVELPKNTTIVDRNAFENCTFSAVLLHEAVEIVSDKAFAGCVNLRQIIVEGKDTVFTGDPFPNNHELTIFCKADSAARQYARSHSIRCVIED